MNPDDHYACLTAIASLEARVTALEGVPIAAKLKFDPAQRKQFLDAVAEAVAQEFDLYVYDLIGKSRKEFLAWPRHAALGLTYELGLRFGRRDRLTFEEIAAFYSGRDHGTVIHGCKRMAELVEIDSAYRRSVCSVRNRLSKLMPKTSMTP